MRQLLRQQGPHMQRLVDIHRLAGLHALRQHPVQRRIARPGPEHRRQHHILVILRLVDQMHLQRKMPPPERMIAGRMEMELLQHEGPFTDLHRRQTRRILRFGLHDHPRILHRKPCRPVIQPNRAAARAYIGLTQIHR